MSGVANINLPNLIAERRSQKRRSVQSQIQHDLDVIANRRKYKKDLEAFPKDTFQRLCRDNVWENVLGYLTGASDVTSAYFTSPVFAEILEERRKLIFLPETLKVLHEGKALRDEDGLLTKHELLRLRGTSKAWKKEADRIIFEEDFLDESWFLQLKNIPSGFWDMDIHKLTNEKSVDDALSILSNVPGSDMPLVRKLCVSDNPNQEDTTVFRDKVLEFLKVHGHSVWYFDYFGKHRMSDFNNLREMLKLLPSLKALVFSGGPFLMFSSPAGLQYLENTLERDPFPIMDSLEYLYCLSEHSHFQEHLLKRCVNLKCVRLGFGMDQKIGRNILQALRRLRLERFHGPSYIIRSVPSSKWTIKVLTLRWNLTFREMERSSVLWPALNRLGTTLEVLKIKFPMVKDGPCVNIQLPHLKKLELYSMDKASIGFDDILGLKSLENIIVENYVEKERPHDEDALVKVYGIQREMNRSNIWAIFPNLTRLEFTKHALVGYIREGTTLTQYKVIHYGESDWEVEKVCQICAL